MGYTDDFRNCFTAEVMRLKFVMPAQARSLADYATAQAQFESENFSSPVFRETMNAIGYKHVPGSRWQCGRSAHPSTEGDYYAAYKTLGDCARELANWIYRRREWFAQVVGLPAYVALMKQCGYFGCPEAQYLHGLMGYFSAKPPTSGLA